MKQEEKAVIVNEINTFIDKWSKVPFPLKTRGKNKGEPKWDETPSTTMRHIRFVKTTNNDYGLKVVANGYSGLNLFDKDQAISVINTIKKNAERLIVIIETLAKKSTSVRSPSSKSLAPM